MKKHVSVFHTIRKDSVRKSERCSAPGCLASFSSRSNLKVHINVHNNTIRFNCIYCQYRTSDVKVFGDHLSSHYDELDYKCDTCGYVATTKSHLKQHLDTHSDIKYKCTLCSIICTTRYAHKEHVTHKPDIHEEIGDYRIEIKPKITEKHMVEMFPDRKRKVTLGL